MIFKLEFIFLFSIFLAFNLDATNRLLVLPAHILLFVHSIYFHFVFLYSLHVKGHLLFSYLCFLMLFSQTLLYIVILCHAMIYEFCIFHRNIDILFDTNLLYICFEILRAVFCTSNFVKPTSVEILYLHVLVKSLVQKFIFDCSHLFLDTCHIFDNG
jgi:hypothetical protein